MSLNDVDNKEIYIVPKAPRLKAEKSTRKISFINIIEVDDDSESELSQIQIQSKICKDCKKYEKCKDDGYISDDRYEDSFDEEIGECETNPDSGKMKLCDS